MTKFPPLALRAQPIPFVMHGVPDIEQRKKIRLRIGELFVGRGGRVFLVQRTLARILNAQPGGDNQQFLRRMFVLRLEQHAAERGINRQPREVFAEPRECALFIQRAEFLQQRVAVRDRSGRRAVGRTERFRCRPDETLSSAE